MSEFETWPTPRNDSLPRAARQWFQRAATAERIAANLNSQRDSAILASYAEECYAEAWRVLATGSALQRAPSL